MNIEYRQLDVLRVRFLHDIQRSGGNILPEDFFGLFRCVAPNAPPELERKFAAAIRSEDGSSIDYYKLCDIIGMYQYHRYRVRYAVSRD